MPHVFALPPSSTPPSRARAQLKFREWGVNYGFQAKENRRDVLTPPRQSHSRGPQSCRAGRRLGAAPQVASPRHQCGSRPGSDGRIGLVADEGAVVEGDAVRELLVCEHDISRGHAHLHLGRLRVRGWVRVRVGSG
eukprot:scaffold51746_cov63-Phaeocystis_antarctica.AAC.1